MSLLLTMEGLVLKKRIDQFPPRRFLCYGKSGSGKTTFLATFPFPLLLQLWDAEDKATPIWKRVVAEGGSIYPPLNEPPMMFDLSAKQDGSLAIPVRYGLNKNGRVIVQVEQYEDPDPEHPTAFAAWKARMADFKSEVESWATLATDSVTAMNLAARKREQYVLKPGVKEPRIWFAGATDQLEEALMQRFKAFRTNVVLLAHVDSDKDDLHGEMVFNPAAPGRLGGRADGIPSQYGEYYHLYVKKDEKGERHHWLQTRNDGRYNASTQIDAPNPCPPDYAALWENFTLL